jgi:glycosyltransferase involved in cell wall biosynthesis
MPTVLFLMKYPLHRRDNLQAKFNGQLAAARSLGWKAYCIGWDGQGMSLLGENECIPLKRNRLAKARGYDHTKIFIDLMAAAREAMRRVPIDVLYLRYMPTFRGALKTIKQLKAQGGRLVVEYPTYPPDQENSRFFLRRQVFRYTGRILGKIHPMVDLYSLVGEPCGGTLGGRPAVNILNGVDAAAFPPHIPNPADPTVRLLALASMSGWHGYDRILRSLAAYQGDVSIRVEFAGGDGDGSLAAWKALAQELGLSDRIAFHGPLYGEALDRIVAQCDVGLGSLGMYRYGLTRGVTLKLREYMARGLPFVSAVDDPALPDDPTFALRVPNDDTPIDMSAIVTFALAAKRDPERGERMRAYALECLSWEGVLRAVLERVSK